MFFLAIVHFDVKVRGSQVGSGHGPVCKSSTAAVRRRSTLHVLAHGRRLVVALAYSYLTQRFTYPAGRAADRRCTA